MIQIEVPVALDQQEQNNDFFIENFGRQILVPEINEKGQKKLSKSSVVIIGLGALGTIASQYCVRAGIGKIELIDFDKVELSNLHRQINYTKKNIGLSKALSSKRLLSEIDNGSKITASEMDFNYWCKEKDPTSYNFIIDCTDSYETKIQSSLYAKRNSIDYLSASISSSEGIIFFQQYHKNDKLPCFKCIFPKNQNNQRCLESAMIGPVAGLVSSLACIKILYCLAQQIKELQDQILLIDTLTTSINNLRLDLSDCNHQ